MTEIEAPVAPVLKFTDEVEIWKSPTWTITKAWWRLVPGDPEPLIVTPYAPGDVDVSVQDVGTVAFAVKLTGAGHVTVRPVVGLTVGVRVTVPAKF